jgi:hypothetical protein
MATNEQIRTGYLMDALHILNCSIGIAGAFVLCFTFYMSRKDPTPRMFASFCVDDQGRLYSLGGHHRRDSKGVLQECTTEGWANVSTAACNQDNTTAGTDSGDILRSDN